ncbi:MAG: Panacea domain-containing protein [Chloroflexota bacterium]
MHFDPVKFKELVLYVSKKTADDPRAGATKLNKILFFSDVLAYGQHGQPVSGATYVKLDNGPVPKQLLRTKAELVSAKEACEVNQQYFNRMQKRLIPMREPDLSVFSPAEIALVDQVIELFQSCNASDVSEISHAWSVGWQVARDSAEIPYETVLLSVPSLTQADIERGMMVAQELGMAV